jgi:hypothetical protein
MSLTSTHASDQDINNVDNNSDVNESQSIDINSINLNDFESPPSSNNIAIRVKAKYSKARQKKIHRKSQHLTASNRANKSSSESLSYKY